jgi:hypothetical protein
MSDAARELARLVGVLEDVFEQEALLFRAADYDGIRAVQEKAEPIVARVAMLGPIGGGAINERVTRLIGRRAALVVQMRTACGNLKHELSEVREGEQQCFRVAPAYVSRVALRQRLSVAM